jgi:GntR family transcriptional regulator
MNKRILGMSRCAIVTDVLRDEILSGKLAPGQKLRAERQLCERFNISRVTLRNALSILEQEWLIVRRHGSGTYVSSQPPGRRIPLLFDYAGSMRDHAPSLDRRLLQWEWRAADPFTAQTLQIDDGSEIFYAETVDYLGAQAVAWSQIHIAAAFAQGLKDKHLVRVDFVETWTEACGFTIDVFRQSVEAVAADASVERRLGVRRHTPLLKGAKFCITKDGRVAGFFVGYYHPDHISISLQHRWAARSGGT